MKLALVDDHELVREGLASLIVANSSQGDALVYVGDSVHGALATGPDVVLLDIELGPDQPDVAENTRACVHAGVPVLLISAHDTPTAVRAGMEAGAYGFVPKRVSYQALSEALDSVSRSELYLSRDMAMLLASAPIIPNLSVRELEALRLYSTGLKLSAVAHKMGVSPHTARAYLDRVRDKYEQAGRPARTRIELYTQATKDGLLA